MISLNIAEIAKACDGKLCGNDKIIISNITTDSRKASNGSLFAAIKGENTDGHRFISSAIQNGADAVLCESAPENTKCTYILTDSTMKALQDIAAYILRKTDIPVVGIGGSVGKTSTKEAVASVLGQKFSVLKTQGNFNNELGVPLTVFQIKDEDNAAVIEMGIDDFGQMRRLASIVRPDICILTNIGDCHLENLHDRAGVLKAKSEMFDFVKDNDKIVLNGDDEYLSTVKNVRGIKPVFFGLDKKNDIWADNIDKGGIDGYNCDIHTPLGKFSVHIPKPGIHMVYNALAAAAAGIILGLDLDEIKAGIELQDTVKGRFHMIKTDSMCIIDDCYNANPMSMKASLESLSLASGKKAAILGDMGELGENEKELHYEVGAFAAKLDIDKVICIGKLSKNILKGILDNSEIKTYSFDTIDDFLERSPEILEKGSTVLVKASHFMAFERIVNALKETKLDNQQKK